MKRFLSRQASLVLSVSLLMVEPAALVVVPGALNAQTTISGDIAGTVTDPSGAAVPGVTVTATDTATGCNRRVCGGSEGPPRHTINSTFIPSTFAYRFRIGSTFTGTGTCCGAAG